MPLPLPSSPSSMYVYICLFNTLHPRTSRVSNRIMFYFFFLDRKRVLGERGGKIAAGGIARMHPARTAHCFLMLSFVIACLNTIITLSNT